MRCEKRKTTCLMHLYLLHSLVGFAAHTPTTGKCTVNVHRFLVMENCRTTLLCGPSYPTPITPFPFEEEAPQHLTQQILSFFPVRRRARRSYKHNRFCNLWLRRRRRRRKRRSNNNRWWWVHLEMPKKRVVSILRRNQLLRCNILNQACQFLISFYSKLTFNGSWGASTSSHSTHPCQHHYHLCSLSQHRLHPSMMAADLRPFAVGQPFISISITSNNNRCSSTALFLEARVCFRDRLCCCVQASGYCQRRSSHACCL